MKNTFKFLIFALSFLLLGIANVAAVTVYGEFNNGATSIETSNSTAVYFDANVFSMNPNIDIHIGLYNSAGTEIQTFYENDNWGTNGFGQRFTLTRLDDGTYNIIIQAKDADEDASSTILTLKVSKSNVPVLNHIGDITVVEKEKVIITPHATDASDNTMTYSVSSPDVDSADYNWDGNTFTWTPKKEGTYSFTITASNGNATDSETFNIIVQGIDHILNIKSVEVPTTVVSPGDTISIQVEIQNEGNTDEDNAIIYVKIPALGISSETAPFNIGENGTIKKTLQMTIPSTAADGNYSLTATTIYDSMSKTVTVRAKGPVIIPSENETIAPVVPTEGISVQTIILGEVALILIVCIFVYLSKLRNIRRMSVE